MWSCDKIWDYQKDLVYSVILRWDLRLSIWCTYWSWEDWKYLVDCVIPEWGLRISIRFGIVIDPWMISWQELCLFNDPEMSMFKGFCLMCDPWKRMWKLQFSLLLKVCYKCFIDTFQVNDKIFEFRIKSDCKEFLSKLIVDIQLKSWGKLLVLWAFAILEQ